MLFKMLKNQKFVFLTDYLTFDKANIVLSTNSIPQSNDIILGNLETEPYYELEFTPIKLTHWSTTTIRL